VSRRQRHRKDRPTRGRLRRGAYLLPSLFTTGNLLLGFYAVVSGSRGDFGRAAILVFIAAFFDVIDGRIARMMGTESEFGKEYDSLADLFTFGATPALLAYFWGLGDLGRAGWLIPLFYMVCAAVRLARFNVQVKVVDSRYFVGLPTPMAAGAVCSLFFFAHRPEDVPGLGGEPARLLLGAALVGIGVLMISTFRYRGIKQVDLRERRSYRALAVLAAVLLVLAYHPRLALLCLAVAYALWGPVGWAVERLAARLGRRPDEEGEGEGEGEAPDPEAEDDPTHAAPGSAPGAAPREG